MNDIQSELWNSNERPTPIVNVHSMLHKRKSKGPDDIVADDGMLLVRKTHPAMPGSQPRLLAVSGQPANGPTG
jgi:hypothetical protein